MIRISRDDRNYIDIAASISTGSNRYTLDDSSSRLGVGGNAAVYECIDRQGNIRAVKFLMNISDKARRRFSQEIDVLLKLNHPHIIKYVDHGEIEGKTVGRWREKKILPFLIMEKADMNIVDYMLAAVGDIKYDVYAPQIRGLADALQHLHKEAIHRDIKPENILVRGETWLLSDLGLCTAIEEEEKMDLTRINERIGPKYWLSPEASDKVYFGKEEIDAASDVYQLCAVFWFIITRRYPLGVIEKEDYKFYNCMVCEELLKALKYNKSKRTQNAGELYENVCKVTIDREMSL